MAQAQDVVVIGAGVVGLSAARRLAAKGAKVTVLDATSQGGQGTRAAAGVAIPSVRLVDDPDLLRFVREARAFLEKDLQAFPEPQLLRRGQGILRVCPDQKTKDALEQSAGSDHSWLGQWVDGPKLFELEPSLQGTPVLGAYLTEDGFMVDTEGYANALLHDAAKAGATLRMGESVVEVREDQAGVEVRSSLGQVRADRVLVTAGAWSGALPGLPPLPVRPMRGQMLTVWAPAARLTRILSGATYLAPWRQGEIVIGATEEDAGFNIECTITGLLQLLAGAAKVVPKLRDAAFRRCWAGLRAATPNGQPFIGVYPGLSRVFVGSGLGGQGILSGAFTGHALVDTLEKGSSAAEAFTPARVLGRIPASHG